MIHTNSILHIIWDVEPGIIPELGFLRWYGLFWALGILFGHQIMSFIYKAELQDRSEVEKLVTYLVLGIVVGARLGHIIFYEPLHYWNNPIELLPIRTNPHFQFIGIAGLASHGGVIGALIALNLYTRRYNKNYVWVLDRLTISASLLGCFIRLGNLMNSEIIGTPTTVSWAFIFVRIDQVPRHPAQLYEALSYLLIFVLLLVLWYSKTSQPFQGLLFGLGFTLIFIQRFLVEFVKENQVAFEDGLSLNIGQILSIPMILIGLVFLIRNLTKSFAVQR